MLWPMLWVLPLRAPSGDEHKSVIESLLADSKKRLARHAPVAPDPQDQEWDEHCCQWLQEIEQQESPPVTGVSEELAAQHRELAAVRQRVKEGFQLYLKARKEREQRAVEEELFMYSSIPEEVIPEEWRTPSPRWSLFSCCGKRPVSSPIPIPGARPSTTVGQGKRGSDFERHTW